MKKKFRVYADTSVFGGCFDDEFKYDSKAFFDEIKNGSFTLVISDTVLRELNEAPDFVQKVLTEIPVEHIEIIQISEEIILLRNSYIEADIISEKFKSDAEYIAVASVAEVDFVVSWNFKYIVHFDKIRGYQAINLLKGYKPISIFSPKEII